VTTATPSADHRLRLGLLETALGLFAQHGYHATSLRQIVDRAGCEPEQVYRLFGRKEGLVLALYHRLAVDLEARVPELQAGTLAERFAAVMQAKFALIAPHRRTLRALLAAMVDPEGELAVLGPHSDRVRTRVSAIFAAVVQGASDRPPAAAVVPLTRTLYALHLGLIFCWLLDQTPDGQVAGRAVDFSRDLLATATPFLAVPEAGQALARVDGVLGALVQPPHDPAHHGLAENILRIVFRHRRLQGPHSPCAAQPCPQCFALHLPNVESALAAGEPVHFLLPGFPAKSANPHKTLGPLPDMGEELAVQFLQSLCDEVRELHPPGARITICSDGRVFSDLVGVTDEDVTAYHRAMAGLLARLGAGSLDLFDMDDVFGQADHEATRARLVAQYAEPLGDLVERTRQHEHHRQMFNGIHRFLFEDRSVLEPHKSRTQVRNECKDLAYEVIRRSNAWSRLIADCFPQAVRLSIHPQPPHSDKVGLLLTRAEDNWLTPWHGVVVLEDNQFTLTHRARAEERGAKLVLRDGRPSHYEMPGGGPKKA
jgi:pyoverdine/dityrosine biosynthesis protein Dit1/AcrR family transcriptional regulator